MIDGLKSVALAAIEPRSAVRGAASVTRTGAIASAAAAGKTPNPAADLAAWGPIVDHKRIEGLREKIAGGTYQVDANRIAKAMITTDLPAPKP